MHKVAITLCLVTLALIVGCVDGGELADIMEPSCGASSYPHIPEMTLPPMARSAEPAPDAPVVAVAGDDVELDGMLIGKVRSLHIDEVEKQLIETRQHLETIAKLGRKVETDRLVFAAESRVPTLTAIAILTAIHESGFTKISILGEPNSAPPAPAALESELAAELRAMDPAMRAMRLAQVVESAIWLCPDLTAIFSALAAADPAARCELMVAGFREMSAFCLGNNGALTTAITLTSTPRYTAFRTISFSPAGPFGPARTWGELLGALGPSNNRLGFVNGSK